MRRFCIIVAMAAISMEMAAATASAQVFSGRQRHSYYDGYDYDAAVGVYALTSADNASQQAAQSYQAWRQQAGSSQMSSMQSNIQSALNADAQRRTQDIYSQQQGNRDWWFQAQQQQVAQRQAAATQLEVAQVQADAIDRLSQKSSDRPQDGQYETSPAPLPGFESEPAIIPPTVPLDVIPWPPVLRFKRFADGRAQIEAPYRRSSKGLSTPTAKDYKNMIDAAEKMKTTLKGVANILTAQDYLNTVEFLDQLVSEARGRLEKAVPKK
jgi:hypothetical protein